MKSLMTLMCAVIGLSVFGADDVASASYGKNEIRLYRDGDVHAIEVYRGGVQVVDRTSIGLKVAGRNLTCNGVAPKIEKADLKGRLETPIYKKSSINLAGQEVFVNYGDWGIRLIARGDGVAYRFETAFDKSIVVDDETFALTLPKGEVACWYNKGTAFGCEETIPQKSMAQEIVTKKDFIYLPFLYTVGGKTVCMTDVDVRDYPTICLKRDTHVTSQVAFNLIAARQPLEVKAGLYNKQNLKDWQEHTTRGRHVRVSKSSPFLVETKGTRTFPWRAFMLADSPAKLCEADIVYALATPQAEGDFSWVKPGKVAWDWWNCFDHLDVLKGCTTKGYERFIDFAAKNGVEYVIMDEGWSEKLNIWKTTDVVDVPYLINYAKDRGVGIILWIAWAQAWQLEEEVAEHFAKMGVAGFKVDFFDRGDADISTFMETFAAACARHKLVVDYHGVYHPTGMQRMYPNILNYEAIHGLENMKWYKGRDGSDMMSNDVMAFYLRLSAGPMDYTPGAMLHYSIGKHKLDELYPASVGTRCRQMAMMALYEAPLQMLCDSPTNYEKNMGCFQFMAQVPVVWAKTVALGGTPDTIAACARQAKDGTWYAAGIASAEERDFTVNTDFLKSGSWMVEIFRDAETSARVGETYVHEWRDLEAGEKIFVNCAPGGGFIMRFTKR